MVEVLDALAKGGDTTAVEAKVRGEVKALTTRFPIYWRVGVGDDACAARSAASRDTDVKDSRPTEDDAAIRRRRRCPQCGGRFTTFERVQLRDLIVLKRSGRRVPFDRDKLRARLQIALRKRPVDRGTDRADDLRHRAPAREPGRERDRPRAIGEMVMEALADLDPVGLRALRLGLSRFPRRRPTSPLHRGADRKRAAKE